MGRKIGVFRRFNWYLIKKFSFGIKRNYPFRTSAVFARNYFKGIPINCIEIGTHRGESAEYLLNKNPNIIKIYCIDPYFEDWMTDGQPAPIHLAHAKKRLKRFGKKVEFIKKTSKDAADIFRDNSIDFIYIDGPDDYESIKKDIEDYYLKIKEKGIISGHDINRPSVTMAVLEFCRKYHHDLIIKEMDWIVVKKKSLHNDF
tara:strand:- start:528 stop:1130 length:603 start_codon:yes stop_codon:yes gene_type:complete